MLRHAKFLTKDSEASVASLSFVLMMRGKLSLLWPKVLKNRSGNWEIRELLFTFVKNWISMADELRQTLNRTAQKAQIVLQRYLLMKQKVAQTAARADELERELEKTKAENQRLRSQVQFLKMASVVAPDREDVERTRALISGLVRDIDRCIADLND